MLQRRTVRVKGGSKKGKGKKVLRHRTSSCSFHGRTHVRLGERLLSRISCRIVPTQLQQSFKHKHSRPNGRAKIVGWGLAIRASPWCKNCTPHPIKYFFSNNTSSQTFSMIRPLSSWLANFCEGPQRLLLHLLLHIQHLHWCHRFGFYLNI